MDGTADQFEMFPLVDRRLPSPKGLLRLLDEATERHGTLATQAQVAAALGVSRQRVNDLVKEGRLATVAVADYSYIPLASIEAYLAIEVKAGRPPKQPSLGALVRATFRKP